MLYFFVKKSYKSNEGDEDGEDEENNLRSELTLGCRDAEKKKRRWKGIKAKEW